MQLNDFFRAFPDENACQKHLKKIREKNGVCCKKCTSKNHYWLPSKKQWQCKNCKFRTTLRSGTIFHGSNLKLKTWFDAIYMISNTKKSISSLELQRKLNLKRYEPAWYMIQKIRLLMYQINDFDPKQEVFVKKFTVFNRRKMPNKVEATLKEGDLFRNNHIGGVVALERSKSSDIKQLSLKIHHSYPVAFENPELWELNFTTSAVSGLGENLPAFEKIKPMVELSQKQNKTKKLSWVNTAVENFKNIIYCIHHKVSLKYLQLYMEEFCFKYNFRKSNNLYNILLINGLCFYW